jgi:hypothetical protein
MRLIATYDYTLNGAEIARGAEFHADEEHARSLIRQGAAMTPEKWAKRKPEADANWLAAVAIRDETAELCRPAMEARAAKLAAEEANRAEAWR